MSDAADGEDLAREGDESADSENYFQLPGEKFDAKAAAMRVAAHAPPPGEAISHARLNGLLGVLDPREPGLDFAEIQKRTLYHVDAWSMTRLELLREYSMDFASVRGFGYKRVPPNEQASLAEEAARENMVRALAYANLRAKHVDLIGLTNAELAQRSEALERIARQRQNLRQQRREHPF